MKRETKKGILAFFASVVLPFATLFYFAIKGSDLYGLSDSISYSIVSVVILQAVLIGLGGTSHFLAMRSTFSLLLRYPEFLIVHFDSNLMNSILFPKSGSAYKIVALSRIGVPVKFSTGTMLGVSLLGSVIAVFACMFSLPFIFSATGLRDAGLGGIFESALGSVVLISLISVALYRFQREIFFSLSAGVFRVSVVFCILLALVVGVLKTWFLVNNFLYFGFIESVSLYSVIALSGLISVTPGGVGVREGVYVATLVTLGVDLELATIVSLVDRFVVTGVALLLPMMRVAYFQR